MSFDITEYELVKDRLPIFYAKYEDGRCTTEIHSESENHVTIKASLYGSITDQVDSSPLSTGYAREERGGHIDKYTENAETSAIGRALANLNLYGKLAVETGNRPSREEMNAVKKPDQNLTAYAKDDLQLKQIPEEDYSEFEEVIAPPKPPPSKPTPIKPRNDNQQKLIREKDGLKEFEVPETFSCVWGGYCNEGSLLKQEIARRGPNQGDAVVVCRIGGQKHGEAIAELRGDGKEWCNYEEGLGEFQSKAARNETAWSNGSETL